MTAVRARWLIVLLTPALFAGITPGTQPDTKEPPKKVADSPNLLVDLSREFVAATLEQDVDRTDPVVDIILGTRIRGTSRTVGKVDVELIPNDEVALLDVVTRGTVHADTVGTKGPVQLYSESVVPFQIRKRVMVHADGVAAGPACASAHGSSVLKCITTNFCLLDPLVRRIAYREYLQNKDEAQAIANYKAEVRLAQGLDRDAGPKLAAADRDLKKKIADLRAEGVPLKTLHFRTTDDTLMVRANVVGPKQAPVTSPPPPPEKAYVTARVHETFVNRTTEGWAGNTYTGEQFQQKFLKALGQFGVGPKKKSADDQEWTLTFIKENPIEVIFADMGMRMTVKLEEFTSGDAEYTGMYVTAQYKIQKDGETIKFVRQGPIEAFPPTFKPGQKLNVRQQVMRTVLQKRFARFFKEEVILEPLELPDELKSAGPLVATRAETANGWLLMTWDRGVPKE